MMSLRWAHKTDENVLQQERELNYINIVSTWSNGISASNRRFIRDVSILPSFATTNDQLIIIHCPPLAHTQCTHGDGIVDYRAMCASHPLMRLLQLHCSVDATVSYVHAACIVVDSRHCSASSLQAIFDRYRDLYSSSPASPRWTAAVASPVCQAWCQAALPRQPGHRLATIDDVNYRHRAS